MNQRKQKGQTLPCNTLNLDRFGKEFPLIRCALAAIQSITIARYDRVESTVVIAVTRINQTALKIWSCSAVSYPLKTHPPNRYIATGNSNGPYLINLSSHSFLIISLFRNFNNLQSKVNNDLHSFYLSW